MYKHHAVLFKELGKPRSRNVNRLAPEGPPKECARDYDIKYV